MTKDEHIKNKEKTIRKLRKLISEQQATIQKIEWELDYGLKTKDLYEKDKTFRKIYQLI